MRGTTKEVKVFFFVVFVLFVAECSVPVPNRVKPQRAQRGLRPQPKTTKMKSHRCTQMDTDNEGLGIPQFIRVDLCASVAPTIVENL